MNLEELLLHLAEEIHVVLHDYHQFLEEDVYPFYAYENRLGLLFRGFLIDYRVYKAELQSIRL